MSIKCLQQYLAAVALAGGVLATASHASAQCVGGSVLHGGYGVAVNGSNGSSVPKFITGTMKFNGACGFTADLNVSENGITSFYQATTGTYNTMPDGTIALSLPLPGQTAPDTYEVSYAPLFAEAVGDETDTTAVATIDLQSQSPLGLPIQYNVSSMRGTFAVSCSGISGTYSDLNVFKFDGAGNITSGMDYYNNYLQPGINTYVGTYAVDSNGVFSGGVTLGGNLPFGISGSISNTLSEISFVYDVAPDPSGKYPAVALCTGKRVR